MKKGHDNTILECMKKCCSTIDCIRVVMIGTCINL